VKTFEEEQPFPSVAFKVKAKVPVAVGVPEIVAVPPEPPEKERPAEASVEGRAVMVTGLPVVFATEMVSRYVVPKTAVGSVPEGCEKVAAGQVTASIAAALGTEPLHAFANRARYL
jgi:hypothetical protein